MSQLLVGGDASGRLVAVAGASGGPLNVSAALQTLARWVQYQAGMQACIGSCSAVLCMMRVLDFLVEEGCIACRAWSQPYGHYLADGSGRSKRRTLDCQRYA
jgi:hypothetical protein